MKRTVLVIVLLLMYTSASAQLFSKEKIANQENFDKDFLTWGYFLGFNSYDFKFQYNADQANRPDIGVETTIGFNVGLVGDMRINEYLNLRFEPGLYITRRNLEYDETMQYDPYFYDNTYNPGDLFREVKSTYIHFPLLLKVSTKRINNFKPFVVGGVSTALNLSSNEENPDDNASGQFRTKTGMLFYELGFGIDFYLEWFKFTPSIRGVFAINDELVKDKDPQSPWTGNIDKMQTRGVFINFTFQ
ncbi:type IX secretion/gliding motility protein PorT/SprT [Gelidibacter sediminis]|nr:porin family protein [Gelidibacter sediminis]